MWENQLIAQLDIKAYTQRVSRVQRDEKLEHGPGAETAFATGHNIKFNRLESDGIVSLKGKRRDGTLLLCRWCYLIVLTAFAAAKNEASFICFPGKKKKT